MVNKLKPGDRVFLKGAFSKRGVVMYRAKLGVQVAWYDEVPIRTYPEEDLGSETHMSDWRGLK